VKRRKPTPRNADSAFQKFVQTLVERYGTAMAIADQIGISRSAFTRGVKNEGTLSEENLLKLAEAVGEDPGVVLRLAGKSDFADRVERLYGAAQRPLSPTDLRLLALDHDTKQLVLRLVAGSARRRKAR
jgi:plasmid maintenance system antidote protein VapI